VTPGALIAHTSKARKTLCYIEDFAWSRMDFSLRDFDADHWGNIPWQVLDNKMLSVRVVSDQIIDDDDDPWDSPIAMEAGTQYHISFGAISHLFPEDLLQDSPQRAENTHARHGTVEIVSPIFGNALRPRAFLVGDGNKFLSNYFNLYESKPRSSESYFRKSMSYSLWKAVYPDEYQRSIQSSETKLSN